MNEQSRHLRKFNAGIIAVLSSIIETRSLETGLHTKHICNYVKVLMGNLAANYPEYMLNTHCIDIITDAASLHDIGKIAIPDAVLNKPGKLTDEEYAVMKTHTLRGCEILGSLTDIADREYLQYAYNICRYHHERWDGGGYPDGLRGDEIPICAQCVGIADCYDVLTTDRIYKKAIPPEAAITLILNGECGAFSPKLLSCLKAVRYEYISLCRGLCRLFKSTARALHTCGCDSRSKCTIKEFSATTHRSIMHFSTTLSPPPWKSIFPPVSTIWSISTAVILTF